MKLKAYCTTEDCKYKSKVKILTVETGRVSQYDHRPEAQRAIEAWRRASMCRYCGAAMILHSVCVSKMKA